MEVMFSKSDFLLFTCLRKMNLSNKGRVCKSEASKSGLVDKKENTV